MPRIIVMADQATQGPAQVLLDESVHSVHLSTDHGATQLIERLGWALNDAEELERARPERRAPRRERSRGDRPAHSPSARSRRSLRG
jgi:hypothetical protein